MYSIYLETTLCMGEASFAYCDRILSISSQMPHVNKRYQ